MEQAEVDLKWAGRLASEGGYHIACFLAQQVGEKALKAFLYARGEALVLGHSVGALCEKAACYHEEFHKKREAWAPLDGFYVATRYPNGLPDGIPARTYNAKTALDAVALAEDIVRTVRDLIRSE